MKTNFKNIKSKQKILMVVAILGLIVITAGVTYAFFSYTKEGTQDNTITTGTITFLYTEVSGVGKGISLTDAFPITDTQGKKLTGEGNVFDFKVTSTTPNKTAIPYEVTARKSSNSNLVEEAVRIYLTKVSGTSEEEVLLDNYNKLPQTSKVQESKYIEKTIYTGKVPADSSNYEENFRLRMWVDEDTNFSPEKDENGNDVYPYNDKKFTITVNVYANAKVVTEEDITDASTAEISKISVGDTELTKVEDETLGYNYETTLPEGTTSTTLDIETQGEYSTVTVERIDSLANSSNIKRLSTKKTVELNPGDNYFKITVTSENGDVENEYTIKIIVLYVGYSLSFDYTGDPQLFSIPASGYYQLETWGAQGGSYSTTYKGGYGGYSMGVTFLNESEDIYIVIGGQGKSGLAETTKYYGEGGYNGGGGRSGWKCSGCKYYSSSGGGATHISTKPGLLSELEVYKGTYSDITGTYDSSEILIVSGGGGGNGYAAKGNNINSTNIASGGGIEGNYGNLPSNNRHGAGGTQINGKNFGAGENCTAASGVCDGGGGGWYGGDVGFSGAGGGSGFIGSNRLISYNGITKVMNCYNCEESFIEDTKTISVGNDEISSDPVSGYAKIGNGYAKITYLGN